MLMVYMVHQVQLLKVYLHGLATAGHADYTQSSGLLLQVDVVTAADLLEMRKNMGKYGINPSVKLVYHCFTRSYYNLLEDAEFQDANLVGDMATKLSGEIGQVFGSRVYHV